MTSNNIPQKYSYSLKLNYYFASNSFDVSFFLNIEDFKFTIISHLISFSNVCLSAW